MEDFTVNLISCCGLRFLVEYADEIYIVDIGAKTVIHQTESLEKIMLDEWYSFDEHEDYSDVATLFEEHIIN